MTDEAAQYKRLKEPLKAANGYTRHGQGEYVDLEDRTIHTNTIEGYFSVFKARMKGTYQHCGKAAPSPLPLPSSILGTIIAAASDRGRGSHELALCGIVGKRLTYRGSRAEPSAM